MNLKNTLQLRRELGTVTPHREDIATLMELATDLRSLSGVTAADGKATKPWRHRLRSQFALISLVTVLGMSIISLSQSSLPGDVLYAPKIASEQVAIYAHPEYRENVMMRRAQEVEFLASRHAPHTVVANTLKNYITAMEAYKKAETADPITGSPVLQYCLAKLRAAHDIATPDTKPLIDNTIHTVLSV